MSMDDIETDIKNLAKSPKKAAKSILHTGERALGMIASDMITAAAPIKGANGLANDAVHTIAGGIGVVALKGQKDVKNIAEGVFLNGTKALFKRAFDYLKMKVGAKSPILAASGNTPSAGTPASSSNDYVF